jgi:hypothetical protein
VGPEGQDVPLVIRVEVLRRATFAAVALIAIAPVASGVGRLTVPPVPCAS